MYQWKNFENRSIFDEHMDNHKVGRFFETQCKYFIDNKIDIDID